MKSYRVLAERIRLELTGLESAVYRAQRAMNAAQTDAENLDIYLDSVALNVHNFYMILERVFSQVATVVDGIMPSGSDWHRDLVIQMSRALSELRPPVISTETIKLLADYRAFRNTVRNADILVFDYPKIQPLFEQLQPLFKQVKAELLLFSDFLEKVADDASMVQPRL